MSIDKIPGISSFKLHPDQMKKDSARKNPKTGDAKAQTESGQPKPLPVSQPDPSFNAEELKRTTQQAREMIEDYIAHVKSQAMMLQKFYPPYPPGSEARVQLLKDIPVFRDQIERLSVEPVNTDDSTTRRGARIQDLEAEIKSMEIRNSLSNDRTSGITVTQSEFTGLY